MSESIKNNRVSIYFSKRKDKELISILKDVEAGDIGWFIKNLMKDGLKYRDVGKHSIMAPVATTPNENRHPDQAEKATGVYDELLNIETVRKELSTEETEDLFDRL